MAAFERMLLTRKHIMINDRYNLIRKIGGGSFGDIFLAIYVNDGEVNKVSNIDFGTGQFWGTIACVKTAVYFGVFVLENGGLGVYIDNIKGSIQYKPSFNFMSLNISHVKDDLRN